MRDLVVSMVMAALAADKPVTEHQARIKADALLEKILNTLNPIQGGLLYENFPKHYYNSVHYALEPNYFQDVIAFQERFGLAQEGMSKTGHVLDPKIQEMRIKFLKEELQEYIASVEMGSMHDAFDALIDLMYVLLGTAHLHRFNMALGWPLVHGANMSKVRCERAEDSKRGTTFDVIKPAGWRPPDLSGLLYPSEAEDTCKK